MIPQSIAHYKITAKLSEGGMGEVHRATDPKLPRDVALRTQLENPDSEVFPPGRGQSYK